MGPATAETESCHPEEKTAQRLGDALKGFILGPVEAMSRPSLPGHANLAKKKKILIICPGWAEPWRERQGCLPAPAPGAQNNKGCGRGRRSAPPEGSRVGRVGWERRTRRRLNGASVRPPPPGPRSPAGSLPRGPARRRRVLRGRHWKGSGSGSRCGPLLIDRGG